MDGPAKMAVAVAAIFLAFKALTLPRRRILAYALLWPGMDPAPFEAERHPDPGGLRLMLRGLLTATVGIGLLVALGRHPWGAILGALVTVHLGLFDALAGFWRRVGFPVERICPDPWKSASIREFWSTRWNRAFHVFVRDRVYRPAARAWGRPAAITAVFLLSGLLHEAVISFPAGGGWGRPTLYFAIHAIAFRVRSRWATAAFVLAPLPLLFHGPFVRNVLQPLVAP